MFFHCLWSSGMEYSSLPQSFQGGSVRQQKIKGVGNEMQRSCLCEKRSDQFLDVYIQEINQETVQVFPGLNCHWFTEVFAGKRAQGCPCTVQFSSFEAISKTFPQKNIPYLRLLQTQVKGQFLPVCFTNILLLLEHFLQSFPLVFRKDSSS